MRHRTAAEFRSRVNRFNRWILRAQRCGLRLGDVRVLTTTGRHSGTPRRVPVGILRHEGAEYLLQAYPKAAWVANARAEPAATLAHGRRESAVRLIEIPLSERRRLLHSHITANPQRVGEHLVRTGLVSSPDAAAVADAAARIAVFRIDDRSLETTPIDG